ncbi:DNL zinc finger-domain-containing protein, partial [Lineolata rhizophorae]
EDVPSYQLTFTCKKCATRSSHRITKQGYHGGTVLISCPGCKARHLISDHLKIFSDRPVTVETILAARGEMVTRG